MEFKEFQRTYLLFIYYGFYFPKFETLNGKILYFVQCTRATIVLVLWMLVDVGVYREGFRKSMEGTAFFVVIGFVTNVHGLIYFYKKNTTHELLNMFEMVLTNRKSFWEKEFFNSKAPNIWILVKLLSLMLLIFASALFFIAPICDAILGFYGIEPLNLPHPYKGLMYNVKSTDDPKDWLIKCVGMFWCWMGMTNFLGSQSAFFIFLYYTSVEMQLLCEKIKILNSNDGQVEEKRVTSSITLNGDGVMTLQEIIQHHTIILKLSRELTHYLGLSFAIQNKVFAICICLTLITASLVGTLDISILSGEISELATNLHVSFDFNYLKAYYNTKDLSRDYLRSSISVITCTCFIVQLFSICFVGNYLADQNNRIFETLYDLPWYKWTPKLRKDFNLMLMQAKKPIFINYRGLSPVSLPTFMQAINSSYSYFMLLRSVMED